MDEVWKDIVGYEGLYQVSNLGNVRSLNYRRTGKPRLLKYGKIGNGYLGVKLSCNGVSENHFVHRLVAKAFITNPLNKTHVNHISEVKHDNVVSNLEWLTPSENFRHNDLHLRRADKLHEWLKTSQGKDHCKKRGKIVRDKLSIEIVGVHKITNETIIFLSAAEASRNGFSQGAISSVIRGERSHHKGYKWYRKSDFETIQLQG